MKQCFVTPERHDSPWRTTRPVTPTTHHASNDVRSVCRTAHVNPARSLAPSRFVLTCPMQVKLREMQRPRASDAEMHHTRSLHHAHAKVSKPFTACSTRANDLLSVSEPVTACSNVRKPSTVCLCVCAARLCDRRKGGGALVWCAGISTAHLQSTAVSGP